MLKLLAFALLVLAACGPYSSADGLTIGKDSMEEETFAGTRGLIDNVLSNLQQVAAQAGQSITNFTSGIQEQVEEFREDLTEDANKIRETVQEAITNASSNLVSMGTGLNTCITNITKAAEVKLNKAVYNITSCAEGRLSGITSLVLELINATISASTAAEEVKAKAIECGGGTTSRNIFSLGTCLGSLLWETKVKAATITGKSAILIARINLSLAALPATLNICAAAKITQAALGTAQLAQNLAQCSLSTVIANSITN